MFSTSDRRNIAVGSLLVVALTFACSAMAAFYKSAVPEQVDHSTMNVTVSDYEQALARWKVQAIKEYELVIHSGSDDVTLRVNVLEKDIEILQHLHGGSPLGDTIGPSSARLRAITIEKLFDQAGQGLDVIGEQAASQFPPAQQNLFFDYYVRFDQTMGYPTYYAQYQRLTQPSREIVWRKTVQEPIEVRSLKVIK